MPKSKTVKIEQRVNEHSANVFVRAAKLVRVGQILIITCPFGGPDSRWVKVDARKNAGTAWRTA